MRRDMPAECWKTKAIEHYVRTKVDSSKNPSGEIEEAKLSEVLFMRGSCPDCGGIIEHESGCLVCKQCGYSEC